MDSRGVIRSVFGSSRALIGVIHLRALPGTPCHKESLGTIVEHAVQEARCYAAARYDGIMIENTHDRPFLNQSVGPEITAAMTVVGTEIRRAVSIPLGIQVLAGANAAAVAVAHAAGATFVRVEGFVFAHVADEGIITGTAGELLRYRRRIGADHIRVFADVKKKHAAHAMTADVDIVETAKAAEFFLADGVIVSGVATGSPTDPTEVAAVSRGVGIPTLVGSGITSENIGQYPDADALIVGSWVKKDGVWSNPLDEERVRVVAQTFAAMRR